MRSTERPCRQLRPAAAQPRVDRQPTRRCPGFGRGTLMSSALIASPYGSRIKSFASTNSTTDMALVQLGEPSNCCSLRKWTRPSIAPKKT